MQGRSGPITWRYSSCCARGRRARLWSDCAKCRKAHSSTCVRCRLVTKRPSAPGSQQILEQFEKEIFAYRDPEPKFTQAGMYNPCLGNTFTARLMKSAIEGGFCGYDSLKLDPILT